MPPSAPQLEIRQFHGEPAVGGHARGVAGVAGRREEPTLQQRGRSLLWSPRSPRLAPVQSSLLCSPSVQEGDASATQTPKGPLLDLRASRVLTPHAHQRYELYEHRSTRGDSSDPSDLFHENGASDDQNFSQGRRSSLGGGGETQVWGGIRPEQSLGRVKESKKE